MCSRAAVILFYVGAGALLSLTGSHHSALHVHHLYLGFAIAMWAEFDHPVSICSGRAQSIGHGRSKVDPQLSASAT
jgi:hypothetical protein